MARKKTQATGPKYYTTYQVAKFLGVSLPTVVNWVNMGILPAHRTPGGHRRIGRNDLIAFARDNNYPLRQEFLMSEETRLKVLVVDDEVDFADMISDFLTLKAGLEVETANSGFAAGVTVMRFKPDIIVLDLMMPGMDGFDVLHSLKRDEETKHVPVIACTGHNDQYTIERVNKSGFSAHIAKPVSFDELLNHIQSQLGIRKSA